jgi:hypothetical protein
MVTEQLSDNRQATTESTPAVPTPVEGSDLEEHALRELALRHLEHVRKFKLYLSIYVLTMLVLTPVWIVTQYETSPGWLEHLSSRSRYPGDWDPWIIWVALIGAILVAIAGFRAYSSRANSEEEIEREIEQLKSP